MKLDDLAPILLFLATIGAAIIAARATKSTSEINTVLTSWKDLNGDVRVERDYWRARAIAAEDKLAQLQKEEQ